MADVFELRQAIGLLAASMASGAVLSACKPPPSAPTPPVVTRESTAPEGPSDVAALRRAAQIVDEWHRRDPSQTQLVLREHGIFACDETTTACIAAKQAADEATHPSAPDAAARVEVDASAPSNVAGVRVPTRDTRPVRHPDDLRAVVA